MTFVLEGAGEGVKVIVTVAVLFGSVGLEIIAALAISKEVTNLLSIQQSE
jgi:hypothetical protein